MLIKVAVVQFEISPFAPQENLEKAEQFIQQAAAQEADLIVFPEDFIAGPLDGRVDLADFDQQYVKHFQKLAAQYRIDIVPGSIIEGDENGLYNTAYYIDRDGDILSQYRKLNLWLPERSYITPGNDISVFETRFGKVGLIICWDLMFPEMFHAMMSEGVEMVICPSYWCLEDAGKGQKLNQYAEVTLVNALCIARAFENEIVLVYANAAGKQVSGQNTSTLIGQSQITIPFKGPLDIAMDNFETMLVEEVDLDVLAIAEEAYEIRSDLQKGITGGTTPSIEITVQYEVTPQLVAD
ncbi:MAG TPA: carbon-nitrogen hydrolase family protein [Ktedonobacteraceae bacterium]|nr:carbon-nitrogen hydrolase family protein [Ktedonobacteraceae bacterium]